MDWKDMKRTCHYGARLSYYLLSDSLMVAIDHSYKWKPSWKLQSIRCNLKNTKTGKEIAVPEDYELSSLGGGYHRAYNHQGFISH